MAYVPLTGGAYTARGLIAAAQSCTNLIPERMPQEGGEPAPAAHYPTPGLRLLSTVGTGPVRGLYRASNQVTYCASGAALYALSNDGLFAPALLGALSTSAGPVSMADNGVDLLAVDGSASGYHVLLAGNVFSTVSDPAFYGGDKVDCLDGYFVLNRPGTNQFYISNNVAVAWNPLYVAAKSGGDLLVGLAVTRRELWLIGERTTEVWSDIGAADFPLQIVVGGIEQGCRSGASVVRTDGAVFWVGRSRDGEGVVFKGDRYEAQRISTHAVEWALAGYPKITDAVGWSYLRAGHTVIVFDFPSGGATWCYDLATQLWHQWSSSGGIHRGICHAATLGLNLVGDRQTGALYSLEAAALTDNGAAITRQRAFPHLGTSSNRAFFHRLVVDMATGTVAAGQPEPQLSLDWSDDRGATFGAPVTIGMGAAGAGNTSLQFRRLGMGRGGRVFRLTWSAAVETALQGAWLEVTEAAT